MLNRLHNKNKSSNRNKILAVVAALVVIGVGYGIIATRAAGPFAVLDAKNTTVAGPAKLVDNASVSGGKAILFDQAITTPPTEPPTTPPSNEKPTAVNTGPHSPVVLTPVNGDLIISKDNEVVSGKDVKGDVEIRAKNVTFKDSIVRGRTPPCTPSTAHPEAAIWVREDYSASATIQDVEVNGSAIPVDLGPCLDGIWAANTTLIRVNVNNVNDGIKAHDNVTIRDSFIHDLRFNKFDPLQGASGGDGTHNDGIQTYEGNQNIQVIHNNIQLTSNDNATYQLTQDFGKKATNIHIENNWLDGGGCTLNLSHKGGPTPMTGIYVVNNRFGRNSGYKNCPILLSTKTTLSQNSGNVWDDNGTAIVAPQVHD